MAKITTWEYLLVSGETLTETSLNALGSEGWELVMSLKTDERPGYRSRQFIFKRAK